MSIEESQLEYLHLMNRELNMTTHVNTKSQATEIGNKWQDINDSSVTSGELFSHWTIFFYICVYFLL